jgi:hypothetical protein
MVARETLRFSHLCLSQLEERVQKPLPNMRQGDRRLTHALAGAGRYPPQPSALRTHRRVLLSHGAVIGVSTHRRIRCCWQKEQAWPGVPRLRCHAWPKFWPFIFPWAQAIEGHRARRIPVISGSTVTSRSNGIDGCGIVDPAIILPLTAQRGRA